MTLGVSDKTLGTIWMAGRAHVAGRGDQATLDFQLPKTLEFGAAYRLTSQLTLVAQSRWVEFSAFEDTELRFAHRPFLDRSAVTEARDRFRLGGGLQYVLYPGVTLQVGFSWERWAIKSASLAPTLHDHTEYYLFPTGITIEHGLWQVHVMAGQGAAESVLGWPILTRPSDFWPTGDTSVRSDGAVRAAALSLIAQE